MKRPWPIIILLGLTFPLQAQSFLDKRVSFSVENALLETALSQLSAEAGIPFSFSNNIIPPGTYVSYTSDNQTLAIILQDILGETSIGFKALGPQLILFKKEPEIVVKYTLSGYVRDADSGESLVGAVIYCPSLGVGTYTNEFGFYSLTFEEGLATVKISCLGHEGLVFEYKNRSDRRLNFNLKQEWLTPVVISYFPDSIPVILGPSAHDLNMKLANRMASIGGESDLVRTAFSLPGIQTGADGFGGLSIRGGNIDQNLFLLDGVPVYNAMHGLGLFSIYNSSAIRSAKILKGAFPARYGGRMSSVWDIQTKEGNKNEFRSELDIGVTSAKLTLESPFPNHKGSVFFSGRRALFDFYAEPISRKLRGNGGAVSYKFSDLNVKLNYDPFPRDRLYLSLYRGNDNYNDRRVLEYMSGDTTSGVYDTERVDWGNQIIALRWNHEYSNTLFCNSTFTYSQYKYASQDLVDLQLFNSQGQFSRDVILQRYASEIEDYSAKFDFDYLAMTKHKIKFGGHFTFHKFNIKIANFEEVAVIDEIDRDTIGEFLNLPLYTDEYEAYVEDEIEFSERWRANLGFRVSSSYVLEKWFVLPQPRLLFTYQGPGGYAYDFSITRMTQFLHLISPSRLGLPKDLWVSATAEVPPQSSWQFTSGFNKKLGGGFSIDVDVYYKQLYNQLFLKGKIGSLNAYTWQDKVIVGSGRSYGAEFLLQKQGAKWNGWLSYTLSWSNRQFPDRNINEGNPFPIKLDRRHNFNLQALYMLNDKWDFALGFIIASGSFYSLPSQEYRVQPLSGVPTSVDLVIPISEGINDKQFQAYHRLDFSTNYYFKGRSSNQVLKLGVTNVYSRLNPFFRTLRDKFEPGGVLGNEFVDVSLLPIFPTLRYVVSLK